MQQTPAFLNLDQPQNVPLREEKIILLVDDDEVMRQLARTILQKEGYTVVDAKDGIEALEKFYKILPDLLLIDFMMPELNGIEVCERLQSQGLITNLPVIMLTALHDLDTIDHAFGVGVTDFITKPVQWNVLRHRVKRLLEWRSAQLQIFTQSTQLELLIEQRTSELKQTNEALQLQIAQRQRVEAELRRSERQLRQITDTMLDAVYQTDELGMVEYASPSCWQVLGYHPNQMINQSIYVNVHPEDLGPMRAAVSTLGMAEYRFKHGNGDYIWLETLANIIIGEDKPVTGIVFASRNITERKQAERELQELNRLKTEFLSTAAHELRTPLTTIRGFSEILITRELALPRQKQYLTMINDQSTQLAKLIDDLLDISRLEAKRRLTLNLEELDLQVLVNTVVMPFAESTARHQFDVQCLTETPIVLGDPTRLSQVIQNLLSNAVKYSPRGGNIKVLLTKVGDTEHPHIQFSVSDQGVGMTDEQQIHLFEKFYRADASNTAISGTGLGLAISKMIVELHNGQIWAESKAGEGSTFCFTIPCYHNDSREEQ